MIVTISGAASMPKSTSTEIVSVRMANTVRATWAAAVGGAAPPPPGGAGMKERKARLREHFLHQVRDLEGTVNASGRFGCWPKIREQYGAGQPAGG